MLVTGEAAAEPTLGANPVLVLESENKEEGVLGEGLSFRVIADFSKALASFGTSGFFVLLSVGTSALLAASLEAISFAIPSFTLETAASLLAKTNAVVGPGAELVGG